MLVVKSVKEKSKPIISRFSTGFAAPGSRFPLWAFQKA